MTNHEKIIANQTALAKWLIRPVVDYSGEVRWLSPCGWGYRDAQRAVRDTIDWLNQDEEADHAE